MRIVSVIFDNPTIHMLAATTLNTNYNKTYFEMLNVKITLALCFSYLVSFLHSSVWRLLLPFFCTWKPTHSFISFNAQWSMLELVCFGCLWYIHICMRTTHVNAIQRGKIMGMNKIDLPKRFILKCQHVHCLVWDLSNPYIENNSNHGI